MKCIVCKQAETRAGTTTVTLERQGATFVFKDVPAPRNLLVPRHQYLSDSRLLVGGDDSGGVA